jgi:hypothetical protein
MSEYSNSSICEPMKTGEAGFPNEWLGRLYEYVYGGVCDSNDCLGLWLDCFSCDERVHSHPPGGGNRVTDLAFRPRQPRGIRPAHWIRIGAVFQVSESAVGMQYFLSEDSLVVPRLSNLPVCLPEVAAR